VQSVLSSLPSSDEAVSDTESMLNAFGRLWLRGVKADWAGFWRHEKRKRIPLPGYVFDRRRYWVEANGRPLHSSNSNANALEPSAVQCESPLACSEMPAVDRTGVSADEVEEGVAEIWRKLLGVERVGAYDNFFALGGHSMLGAQLLASLRAAFHVEIPLPSLFEVPTVAGMAERIRALR
jgi:acyl transferase domain-containing protein